MKGLYQYIIEGGAAGHMRHPFDYDEFTLSSLKGLIRNLFEGKIEDITEKIDGTNIQTTVNPEGEVVFIRNKGDLNSERGGMSIADMAAKWKDKPSVANTFISAGETITRVFNNISRQFFNPNRNTKLVVNCECVIAGKTNIMPYASSQVDFHNIWVYSLHGDEWIQKEVTKRGLDVIKKACKDIDGAQITPNVIVRIVDQSNDLLIKYIKELDKIFKEVSLGEKSTIGEWKRKRFNNYILDQHKWISEDKEGEETLFNRWFNSDKSTNIKILKQIYTNNIEDLIDLDKKGYKEIVSDCIEPLDHFFLELGNSIIELCDGIINTGQESRVCDELRKDMEDVVDSVRREGSVENNEKLTKQINRLKSLGDKINPVEGIVFTYKDKLMKLTGSFAPLNQILGTIKFSR